MINAWKKLVQFAREVSVELRKVTWPNRQEMMESTSVVLVTVLLMTVFIGLCDFVLAKIVGVILNQGR